jgi:hypothetical protein
MGRLIRAKHSLHQPNADDPQNNPSLACKEQYIALWATKKDKTSGTSTPFL